MNSSTRTLQLLGMARRSGQLVHGVDTVISNARDIVLILLASDAGMVVERKAQRVSEATNVQILKMPYDKERLGWAIGVKICAVMGVIDKGFATNIQYQLQEDKKRA